jgi:hypothetical protein
MPDFCIECQSEDITITEPGITEGDLATFVVECNKCGTKWIEYYELCKIEKIKG